MSQNPHAVRSVLYVGGNLFVIAAEELGDWTQWNRIAALNKMWDFFFTDVRTLKIPPKAQGNGGVLGL